MVSFVFVFIVFFPCNAVYTSRWSRYSRTISFFVKESLRVATTVATLYNSSGNMTLKMMLSQYCSSTSSDVQSRKSLAEDHCATGCCTIVSTESVSNTGFWPDLRAHEDADNAVPMTATYVSVVSTNVLMNVLLILIMKLRIKHICSFTLYLQRLVTLIFRWLH